MLELEITRIFVKVVQNGSFSKAAQVLQLPKSTVSKAVSRLERETATTLMMRTTRSLTVTAAGRAFYDSCLGPINALEDAQKSLYGRDSILSGEVRITAPEDLGSTIIAPAVAQLSLRNPGLHFDLSYTDDVVDLVKDGFDLAIRIGRINESSFKVKKVGDIHLILVASSSYLKFKPKIEAPADLETHLCLSLSLTGLKNRWSLRHTQTNADVQINLRPRITCNQMTSLVSMAKSGGGIALIPSYLVQQDLQLGHLMHVLPEWHSPGMAVSMITPLSMSSSARLKMTTDELQSVLKQTLDPPVAKRTFKNE